MAGDEGAFDALSPTALLASGTADGRPTNINTGRARAANTRTLINIGKHFGNANGVDIKWCTYKYILRASGTSDKWVFTTESK